MAVPKSVQKVRIKQVRDGTVKFTVDRVTRPADVYQAVLPHYRNADREILSVLCLDAQNAPTSWSVVSIGDLNTTRTRPADIAKPAILSNALGIVLVHNHPSGELEPSTEDIEFTRAVRDACGALGIELFDHVIVTDRGYSSLRERGVL